ncbi:hypothetical protein HA397_25025 [Escherichia coli]|nr:hypothetical protein [Escherichia coli]
MKKLVALSAVFPGAALAHGAHAPVPEAAHGLAHAGGVLAGAVIVLVLAALLWQRWVS